jgi:hypothetical protein
MTEPTIIIVIGLIFSLFNGMIMPLFGFIFSKLLFGLSHPPNTQDEVRSNADFYCLMMMFCGVGSAIFVFI